MDMDHGILNSIGRNLEVDIFYAEAEQFVRSYGRVVYNLMPTSVTGHVAIFAKYCMVGSCPNIFWFVWRLFSPWQAFNACHAWRCDSLSVVRLIGIVKPSKEFHEDHLLIIINSNASVGRIVDDRSSQAIKII